MHKIDIPLRNDVDLDIPQADLEPFRECACGCKEMGFVSLMHNDMNYQNPDVYGCRIRLIALCPECGKRTSRALAFTVEKECVAKQNIELYKVAHK
jgi:hypothetical protein